MTKTAITIMAALLVHLSQKVDAQERILTVDNKPGAVAMFSTLEAAYHAANNGDTIVMAGSPVGYGLPNPTPPNPMIYKRINYVGSGYLLAENGIPGVVKDSTKLSGVRITSNSTSSSSGSTFIGLEMGLDATTPFNNIQTSATVDRCKLTVVAKGCRLSINRSMITSVPTFDEFCSGSSIRNSIVAPGLGNFSNPTLIKCSDMTISNCILGYTVADQHSVSISNSMIVTLQYSGKSAFGAAFKGSITNSMAVGYSSSNADRQSFLPDDGGNLNGYISKDVFLTTGSDDAKWQLKEESPAIGAGYSGGDVGPFGGGYILSGVPSRPRITRLTVPASATVETGFRFEVEAKGF